MELEVIKFTNKFFEIDVIKHWKITIHLRLTGMITACVLKYTGIYGHSLAKS